MSKVNEEQPPLATDRVSKDSSESAALPLCPVHQSLEDRGKLEVSIGGPNCLACTLNEREELLEILAPCIEIVRSVVRNIYPDSVSILREVAEFYKTHAGKNRIVTSYPAPITQDGASASAPTTTVIDKGSVQHETESLVGAVAREITEYVDHVMPRAASKLAGSEIAEIDIAAIISKYLPESESSISSKLAALLPELEYSRETHVQWRDCDQKHRDANPQIGDAEFHAATVRDYDNRISTIKEAISIIDSLQAARADDLRFFGATLEKDSGLHIDMKKYHAAHICKEHQWLPKEQRLIEERCPVCIKMQHDQLINAASNMKAELVKRVREKAALLEKADKESGQSIYAMRWDVLNALATELEAVQLEGRSDE